MAEIKTILVTSKDVEGPYRINEEDFDEAIHKHASATTEAAVEKAAEASIAKAEAKAEKEAKK